MTHPEYLGNRALLDRRKVAFFCSRTVSGTITTSPPSPTTSPSATSPQPAPSTTSPPSSQANSKS